MLSQILILVLFPAAMVFAAASDLITMTISNRLSIVLLIGFVALVALLGLPAAQIWNHVIAGAGVLVVTFGCFAMGWIGGGDAKLAAVTSLWLGLPLLIDYLLAAAVLGGALTLAILLLRQMPLPAPLASRAWIVRLHSNDSGVPYGIALAAAGLLLYPDTPFMRALAT